MSKIGSTADSGLTVVREADGRSQPKSLMGITARPSVNWPKLLGNWGLGKALGTWNAPHMLQ